MSAETISVFVSDIQLRVPLIPYACLARFALLYEREGEWDGKQILPAKWSYGHRPFCRSLSVQRFEDGGVSLVNVVVKVDQPLIINLSRPVEDKNWQRF